jgi:beta-aspartyl-peptidase (threonine type)
VSSSSRSKPAWALIVHGGAKEIEAGDEAENRAGILKACNAGRHVLANGGSAMDAVEASIRVLEDLPVFNAGRGSCLNAAGQIEMSAGLMDGKDKAVGGVAGVRNIRNPVSLARQVLAEREVLLIGDGVAAFAKEKQAPTATDEYLMPSRQTDEHDTVGAVALDVNGNLAAGTSTGGVPGRRVGRVGDSPVPGAGFYAANDRGAVSLSGDGESILRVAAAAQIMMNLQNGLEDSINAALAQLPTVGGDEGDGGAIAISSDGAIGWDHNSPHFAVGMITSEQQEPQAWLSKNEQRDV